MPLTSGAPSGKSRPMKRKALQPPKPTAKRRRWFGDLLSGKAGNLLADPVGLNEEEIGIPPDDLRMGR
jgi:hypothetical protein